MKQHHLPFFRYCFYFFCVVIFLLLLYILDKNFLISGSQKFHLNLQEDNNQIHISGPVQSAEYSFADDMTYSRINGPELGVKVFLPKRKVEKFEFTLTYENPQNNSVEVEFPARSDNKDDDFVPSELVIIEEPIIQTLEASPEWAVLEDTERGLKLFQRTFFKKLIMIDDGQKKKLEEEIVRRQPRYSNIEDFLQTPPLDTHIQTSNFEIIPNFDLHIKPKSDENQTVSLPFRGSQSFFFYTASPSLDIDLEYEDTNVSSGKDDITLTTLQGKRKINVEEFSDDGNQKNNKVSSGLKTIHYKLSTNSPGFYRVSIEAGPDIHFKSIRTPAYFVFLHEIMLDDPGSEVSLFYDGSAEVSFKTIHRPAIGQTIDVRDQKLVLEELDHLYSIEGAPEKKIEKIHIPKADLSLSTADYFALSESDFQIFHSYNIQPLNNAVFDATGDNPVEYVITQSLVSSVTEKSNGWRTVKFSLDADNLYFEKNAFDFVLRFVGQQQAYDDPKISEITAKMRTSPLWNK